jgi:hypothetical protein
MAETAPGLTNDDGELMGISAILTAPVELDDVVRELHAVFAAWRAAYPDMPLSDDPARPSR